MTFPQHLAGFLVCLLLASILSRPLGRLLRQLRIWFQRPWVSIVASGMVCVLLNVALSWIRVPQPQTHDEFSYLLAGDTFSKLRWTSPTHPLWMHFETFYVNQQPTYASMYPPAQGMALAFGVLLSGHAPVGVWLSMGCAAAATCWMLQAWVPRRWALAGALLFALHAELSRAWGQCFWGGQVAMIGGALVFGALPRLLREPRGSIAAVMAVGLVILANSRPYEGLVTAIPVALRLAFWLWYMDRAAAWNILRRTIVPAGVVLASAAGLMLFYNHRVTGNSCLMPVSENSRQYAMSSPFVWGAVRPEPEYRHDVIRRHFVSVAKSSQQSKDDWGRWGAEKCRQFGRLGFVFLNGLSPTLLVPLLFSIRIIRIPKAGFAIATFFLVLLANAPVFWLWPHYLAPVTPLLFLWLTLGFRVLCVNRFRGRKCGRTVCRALLLLHVVTAAAAVASKFEVREVEWSFFRAYFLNELESRPGQHLVIVRYSAEHDTDREWVFNGADIDRANVVWAREMDPLQNRPLLDYFAKRNVWLVLADTDLPSLMDYRDRPMGSEEDQLAAAVQRDPANAELHLKLGDLLRRTGRSLAGLKWFRQALKLDPDNAEVYFALGLTYEELDDVAAARKHYQQTLALKPEHQDARTKLQSLGKSPGVEFIPK